MRALLTLCLLALPSMAAVAFDATAISTGQTGSNTITWSHTVGSGANRKLYVGVGGYSEVGATVSSVTCGSKRPSIINFFADTFINKHVGIHRHT